MQTTYQTQIEDTSYNGWTNYETWNVALWIGNDEGLYHMAKEFRHSGYKAFAQTMVECDCVCTPDGIEWLDTDINFCEMDEMLEEL